MSLNEVATTRSAQLRQRAQAFCAAFLDLSSNPPDKILSTHFTPVSPRITEHGPEWVTVRLPFLGRTFTGVNECLEYFSLLSQCLEFQPSKNTFPAANGIVVDADAVGPDDTPDQWAVGKGVASVVGKGVFKAIKTGKSWEEQFIYRLSGFDEEGRIGHWEIWADPLSAYAAVEGKDVEP